MAHCFQCRCGALKGEVSQPHLAVRAVCYCGHCQAYARLLDSPVPVLDALGGTDVAATQARYVRFTSGEQSLACLSLSPNGLLRWYARCCNTPIANTPRDWRLPYVGLLHTCLANPEPMERSFPQVQMHVNRASARGKPPVLRLSGMRAMLGLAPRLLAARLTGAYRQSPFFDQQGVPRAEVRVLPREAVQAALGAVREGRS